MAAIRSRDTGPELALRRALRSRSLLGYRCNLRSLPGKPDIAFTRWKVAVFVDGAFWHGHPDHFRPGTLGEYWDQKIRRTRERDQIQQAELEAADYAVMRFWDFEVTESPDRCADLVDETLTSRGLTRS